MGSRSILTFHFDGMISYSPIRYVNNQFIRPIASELIREEGAINRTLVIDL